MPFNIIKKNPTSGEITSSLTNASDSAGLHFDGAAGNIDIASPPDLGTKFSMEFIIQAEDWATRGQEIFDFTNGGRFALGRDGSSSNLKIYDTGWRDFGVSPLDDGKVHHLVITVDGTAAILYDNGNQAGTTTLGALATIDACSKLTIGAYPTPSDFFKGTLYRTRFWNKTLSQAEVTATYENATVPFSEQYGIQTALVTGDNSDFDTVGNWALYNGSTFGLVGDWAGGAGTGYGKITLAATAGTGAYITSTLTTKGKRYRASVKAKLLSGSAVELIMGDIGTGRTGNFTLTPTGTETVFTGEFVATTNNIFIGVIAGGTAASGQVILIDDVSLVEIGCVADYCLSEASPTASLMLADRSTNSVDGTISASGVTAIAKPIQLNAVAARIGTSAATPADGELVVSGNVGVGSAPHVSPTQWLATDETLTVVGGTKAGSVEIGHPEATNQVIFGALKFVNTDNSDAAAATSRFVAGMYSRCNTSDGNAGDDSGGSLHFATKPEAGTMADALSIDSAGLATFSAGINLGNTASATATTLDGYEEGTWTAALGGTTETLGNATGKYVRIGSTVWISWYSATTTFASSSGAAIINGLPFANISNAQNYTVFNYQHGNAVDGNSRGGYVNIGGTSLNFIDDGGTGAATFVDGDNFIMVAAVYQTDAAF